MSQITLEENLFAHMKKQIKPRNPLTQYVSLIRHLRNPYSKVFLMVCLQ